MSSEKTKKFRKVGDKLAKELVIQGDCLEALKTFEDNSVDSVVTDPPYGLSKEPNIREVLTKWMNGEPYDHGHNGFMGKSWDSFVPHPDIWREVYRVLKPGGHALVFAGTRTQDLMTIALRLAGFEVRDVIEWLYFSGFPKSLDVSKAFDKRAGAEREVVGVKMSPDGKPQTARVPNSNGRYHVESHTVMSAPTRHNPYITAPATELAKKWDGWGTALKPAHEPIIMVRKPFKGAVIDCVEKYGTGAINIDATRIGDETIVQRQYDRTPEHGNNYGNQAKRKGNGVITSTVGRFPANCITLDDNAFYSKYFNISPPELSKKASKKDRNSDWRGEEIAVGERGNVHPTVKPTDLMAWLVRLSTPPNGVVLDPFAGSGSTLVAAKREGFGFIGIEREPEYIEIIEARTHVKAIKGEGEATK